MILNTIAFLLLAASPAGMQSESPSVIPLNDSVIKACGLGIELRDSAGPAGASMDFLNPATFESVNSLICGVYLLGVATVLKHLSTIDDSLEAGALPNAAEITGEGIERYRCLPPGLRDANSDLTADAINEIRLAYLAYVFAHPDEQHRVAVPSLLSSIEESFPCSPAD